jgi:hypothetical protein
MNVIEYLHISDEFFRAEPSWGISIFELKPSWIFLCIAFLAQNMYFFLAFTNFWTKKSVILRKEKNYLLLLKLKIEKFSENPRKLRKIRKKEQFFNFRAEIYFFELKGKGHEPSRKSFSSSYMARASSSRTHHYYIFLKITWQMGY